MNINNILKIINQLTLMPFRLKLWKYIRLFILISLDIIAISLAYWSAFYLRLEKPNLHPYFYSFINTLPIVVIIQILIFWITGIYKQILKFANVQTITLVILDIFFGTIILYLLIYIGIPLIVNKFPLMPRSILGIYFFLGCTFISGQKISWRILSGLLYHSSTHIEKTRCLIYGAGSGGDLILRHILSNPMFPYHPIGFIDDDINKVGKIIHGIKILGTKKDIKSLTNKYNISTIIIAIPSAPGKIIQEIFTLCTNLNLNVLIMPDMANVLDNTIIQPRSINIGDLLKRSPKTLNYQKIATFINNKNILITGAGGSIGSEICRQIAKFNPNSIIMFEACEYNLYKIYNEITEKFNQLSIYPILGNILDDIQVDKVIKQFTPDIIIHAAAYKHVHLVELNPQSGVLNNILGTKIIAQKAITNNVKNFVLISTDKAVNPVGIMGATKRCAELLVEALYNQQTHSDTKFCIVRFGNVLGSSGSVIPKFIEQIQKGGPVTVTHPEVTRYFMLTSEAVGLVLQAAAMSNGGEIFVLNMGDSVKIYDMAQNLIKLAGKTPHKDIEIIFTGLKTGEKLYEELILQGTEKTSIHDDIYVLKNIQKIDPDKIISNINTIIEYAKNNNEILIKDLIYDIIKEKTT